VAVGLENTAILLVKTDDVLEHAEPCTCGRIVPLADGIGVNNGLLASRALTSPGKLGFEECEPLNRRFQVPQLFEQQKIQVHTHRRVRLGPQLRTKMFDVFPSDEVGSASLGHGESPKTMPSK
jgi:hypothetical protein